MSIQLLAIGGKTHGSRPDSRTLHPTIEDIRVAEPLHVRKTGTIKDYKTVIIEKPWGYEYLCGRNKHLEIWDLCINSQKGTSLHSHTEKDTLNIVLEGSAWFESLHSKEKLNAGDWRIIKAGTFHRTQNLESFPLRVLEIESPPNKYDLIRARDFYGREILGYDLSKFPTVFPGDRVTCRLRNNGKLFHTRPFISVENKNNVGFRGVEEVFLENSVIDATSSQKMADFLRGSNKSHFIVTSGSFNVIFKDAIAHKLLPGNVLTGDLGKYRWSAKRGTGILW